MATCLIFVFAALIEFAYVNVNSRVERRRRESSKTLAVPREGTSNNGQKTDLKVYILTYFSLEISCMLDLHNYACC